MKRVFNYFVCDEVAEAIVGQFDAPNDEMAKRIFADMIDKNERLAKIKDSLTLYSANTFFPLYETYEEVINDDYCRSIGLNDTVITNLKDVKHE